MFDLNPLHLPDATFQHVLMLVVAGGLGFLIGYADRQQTIRRLDAYLTQLGRDADEYRRWSVAGLRGSTPEETTTLRRIAARAHELNLDRIGRAQPADADDLKAITGIGPFAERKLNALGIYTYRQLAQLDEAGVARVGELIEHAPDRIARDNWVGQATELANRTAKP